MALARLLGFGLVLGTVLLGIGALIHPLLEGDAEAQLRLIAATPHWRPIHLVMLAGAALVIAGIWVRMLERSTALEALFALAIIALARLFMH